jgi:iron complex transport system substrate-binding protein
MTSAWRARARAGAAAALLLMLLWAAAAGAAPLAVRDDAGREVALARPAERIVALAPHLTELAFAAGAGERVVGVMRYSDFPASARARPVVGDAFTLDFEAIVRLKPDLVLVWGSGINERHKQRLRTLGLTVYESEVGSVDGIVRTLRALGTLAGTAPVADAEAARLHARWRALKQAHAGQAPVRVFYQLWAQPLLTINGRHVIDEALRACGGVNAFAGLPALTPSVSWEAAVRSNPQLIAGMAGDDGRFAPGRWLEFPRVDAVRHGRFAAIDGALIGRMGPRFIDGAEQLCHAVDAARRPGPFRP